MNLTLDWKRTADLLLAERMQERLAFATRLLLLALLAVTLAGLTWRLLDPGDSVAPPVSPRAAPPAQAGGNWNLARWHLFGEAPVAGSVAAPIETLPETRLNLVLRGVVAGENGGAIIGTPNGNESFYTIDARLPGGAVLREVYGDRVVLERSGQRETLRLPRESLDASPPPAARPVIEEPQVLEPEMSLNQYRDLALQNPAQLAEVVQVAPRNEGGRFVGYEVQPGRDPGLLNRVGLMPGDVVTSVNGISLDTPARALGVLRSLRGRNEVTIQIQRGGVPRTLSVNLQD
ncbi:MAG: type II secretion system protein GspC [Gammaproteobacteria bacterium]|jgi:general secretion pathway protein C|nr:type II secretion system protein GspC [Gammaproteobacteria bacterium]